MASAVCQGKYKEYDGSGRRPSGEDARQWATVSLVCAHEKVSQLAPLLSRAVPLERPLPPSRTPPHRTGLRVVCRGGGTTTPTPRHRQGYEGSSAILSPTPPPSPPVLEVEVRLRISKTRWLRRQSARSTSSLCRPCTSHSLIYKGHDGAEPGKFFRGGQFGSVCPQNREF